MTFPKAISQLTRFAMLFSATLFAGVSMRAQEPGPAQSPPSQRVDVEQMPRPVAHATFTSEQITLDGKLEIGRAHV